MVDATLSLDTWLLQRIGGTSKYGNGDGNYLHVGPIPSGDGLNDWKSRIFLEYSISTALSGLTAVTAATLTLTVAPNDCIIGGRGGTIRIFAEKCSGTFTEKPIGSDCGFSSGSGAGVWPGPTASDVDRALHSSSSHSTGDALTWDLTAMLEAARAAGDTSLVLRLIAANSGGTAYDEETAARRIAFYSLQHATAGNRPILSITGTSGSTAVNKSDTAAGVDASSITNTGSGTVNVSDTAVAADALTKAGPVAYWQTIITGTGEEGDEGIGQLIFPDADSSSVALLASVTVTDVIISCKFSVDKKPNNGGLCWRLLARALDSDNYYVFDVYIRQSQQMDLLISKRVADVVTLLLRIDNVGTFIPDTNFFLKLQAISTNPTALSGKVWREAILEPNWQIIIQDSEATLQTDGTVGLGGYVTAITNEPITVTFDNFEAQAP